MRGSNGTNPGAGRRWLFSKSHARLLDDQSEGLARVVRADERVIELARELVALHGDLRAAESHMRAANERASRAEYEAPAVASMRRPANCRRRSERRRAQVAFA